MIIYYLIKVREIKTLGRIVQHVALTPRKYISLEETRKKLKENKYYGYQDGAVRRDYVQSLASANWN